jgi:hypothetical protein
LKCYSLPFAFIIPSGAELPNHDIPPPCWVLPPSFNTMRHGKSDLDPGYCPELSVSYGIHAVVHYSDENDTDSATPHKAKATKDIEFLPYSEIQPPTDTGSFPGEFVLSAKTPIWKHVFGHRLGSIVLRAWEPLPLIHLGATSIASTECTMVVSAHPESLSGQHLRLLSLEVKPAIRLKTFYSAEPIACTPNQTALAETGLLRFHEKVIKLEEQQFSKLEWKYSAKNSANGFSVPEMPTKDNRRPSDSSGFTSSTASDGSELRRSDSLDSPAEGGEGVWSASVKISIKPLVTLLPTFCSNFVARSYSLLICVRVSGAYSKKTNLEIPVQVVYLPASATMVAALARQESSPCVGPVALLAEQDVSFLERLSK